MTDAPEVATAAAHLTDAAARGAAAADIVTPDLVATDAVASAVASPDADLSGLSGVKVARVAVLANPGAGRGRHRAAIPGAIERIRAAGVHVDVLSADSEAEALIATRRAVADGVDAVVAIGGDGTVHLAMQAVAGTPVALGAIPAGTGNDFIREIGLPTEIPMAAEAIARALESGTRRRIDLARLVTLGETPPEHHHGATPVHGPGDEHRHDRWFGAVLAAGFDAIVNERANRMRFPRGPRRYDIAIIAELMRLRPRHYSLRLDGERLDVDAVMVSVANTPSYGGGMRICPAADPTDGLLDLTVVGPIGRTRFAMIKPRVYAGTHVLHPAVTTYRARRIEVAAEGITAYVDGERAAPLPVAVTAMPGALTLLA